MTAAAATCCAVELVSATMPQPRPYFSPFGVVTRHRPGHPAGSTLRVTLSPKDHFRRGQQATARAAAEREREKQQHEHWQRGAANVRII